MEKFNMKQYKDLHFDEINVTVVCGSNIDDAVSDAIALSITNNKKVNLKFRDKEFVIEPNKLRLSIDGFEEYCLNGG